ncbi:hypothetical protein O181_041462 [Austropuccinia psidii MF-1]|uniref:Uncharacterized protein n=1 Tax=Austropuccinia psidii MF-1 TaxID=1389203 RepID=A0A9Q3HEV8_9BASI|nr:hypothetical protein [Austropuccinia psidii MF-1]
MANIKEVSSFEASRPPTFKEQHLFDGTQPLKFRSFIQSSQVIIYDDKENFSEDKKKVLYKNSFLIGKAKKCIEPYLFNITNQDPNYLINHWELFEYQILTLFQDPIEVGKAEEEFDALIIKEGGIFLYISDFRSLVSRICDLGERAFMDHYRKGVTSRILYQLAYHP